MRPLAAVFALLLAVAFASPAAAQSTLVSNTGQTVRSGSLTVGVSGTSVFSSAQLFTTGDNTGGYTLSAVDVRLASNSTSPNDATKLRVSVYSVSSGNPSTSLHVLTNPATFTDDAVNTFTAPANTTLDASTTYALVFETTDDTKRISLRHTDSDSNDSGAFSGWSIADSRRWKNATDSSWSTGTSSALIAIKGTENTASSDPTITISGGSAVTEGTDAEFTVTASEAPSADLTVNLTVSESAGSDYVAASNEGSKTVTITASSTTATYSVATEGDSVNEPNGTVTVAVAAGTGYSVGTADSADVTVNDDDRAAISGATISSSPAFGDTYRRRENVEVTVTWDEDVTWDLSGANARMRVRLDIGGTTRAAELVTGGATSGTARSLVFRYAVVNGDTDGNGLAVTTTAGGDLVILNGGATLLGADGRAARRAHAALAADANHKVDGSVVTKAPAAPDAPTVSSASSTSLSVSWSAPSNLGTATSITDYDLRYFQGTTEPATNAEWIREGETDGPPDPGSNTSATITGLTTGAPYLVQVRAFGDLESPWSASTSGTPQPEAPSAPDAPTVSAASRTSLSVSWSAPDDLGSASSITDYDLRYFAGTADPANEANWIEEGETNGPPDPGSNTSAKITGLTAGTAYRVQVRAFGDRESPWSASASGTPENQAPVFTATPGSGVDESIFAIGGTLISLVADRRQFSDPDGDDLTFSVTMSREDTHSSFNDLSGDPDSGRIFFLSKGSCELANLDPPLSAPPQPQTTVTLTATDPSGETAQITRNYILTSYANSDGSIICPALTAAAVTAETLTLTYEGGGGWTPSNLQASEFTVKVDGTAVNLAATNAVTIGTPTTSGTRTTTPVTLTLAAAVAHGQGVTVSHAPGASPSTVGFADTTVTNNTPEPDTTPPALDSAAVTDDQTLTLTFDEDLATPGAQALKDLRYALSATGHYSKGVRLRNVSPDTVAVSGPTVTLRFPSHVEALPGRDVEVSYSETGAEGFGASLQDASGNKVASFTRTVTRASGTTPPVLTAAQVAGTALTLTFDAALDSSSAPAGERFRVWHWAADGYGPATVVFGTGTASVSGTTVTVTLAEAVPQQRRAEVGYRKGGEANPLRGASAGPEVADIAGWLGTTVLDRDAPALLSASVAGTGLVLYYGEALDTGSTPAAGDFTVTAAGSGVTVSSVAMSASAVKLTLGASVAANAAVTVTYTAGTNPVRDVAGNAAANLSNESVTNLGASSSGKPALASAEAAGPTLSLAFSQDLDPAHVPAASAFTFSDTDWTVTGVTVRGSKAELVMSPGWYPCDRDITLALTYVKPATNALRNVWGAEADGFSGQAVTNARAERCVYGIVRTVEVRVVREASGGSGMMGLQFDRSLDRRRSLNRNAFSITPGAAGAPPVEVDEVRISQDGRGLELALSRAPDPGERMTMNYRRSSGSEGLWDLNGNQFGDFSVEGVAPGEPRAAKPPLTAAFHDLPAEHDGSAPFSFELRFSEDFEGRLPYKTLRDEALRATNGKVTGARRVEQNQNQRWTITVRPHSRGDVTVSLSATADCAAAGAICAPDGRPLSNDVEATVAGPSLTAEFRRAPAEHDGSTFTFRVLFSEDADVTPRVLREDAFEVSGGKVRRAPRVNGRDDLREIHIEPSGTGPVTVSLPATADCADRGAICTSDGRPLSNANSLTVAGPALLSVADAEAREGDDESVAFEVTLSRAASGAVTVEYATADGTAVAGEDYTATSGVLRFAPGETAKTIHAPLLDDVVDDDGETFALILSNASGAALGDAEATATIRNSDPIPQAWLARFGRAASDHAVDAVAARFDGRSASSHATFGGQRLWSGGTAQTGPGFGPGAGSAAGDGFGGRAGLFPATPGTPMASGTSMRRAGMRQGGIYDAAPGTPVTGGAGLPGPSLGGHEPTARDLLLGSSFQFSLGGNGEDGPGGLTTWGDASATRFNGADGDVAVDGEVATWLLGADAEWGRWLGGVALAHSAGSGGFAANTPGNKSGALDSTLTAVHPYLRYRASERVSVWGMLGYGAGTLDLALNGAQPDWSAGTTMHMAAGGGRWAFARTNGFELAAKADARFTRVASDAAESERGLLGAAAGETNRLRFALEGSRTFTFGTRTLTPALEIGARHDGGDAETGAGMDLGGSLRYADAALGLTVEARGRYLAAHEDAAYSEWGASASVRLDPGVSGRGLSFSVAPSWGGAAAGGADRLWSMQDARGLANGGYGMDAGMRLDADAGYGLDAFRGAGSMRPFLGLRMSGFGRDWRAGMDWQRGERMTFGFEAIRRETPLAPPEHGLGLRAELRW